MRKMLFGLFMLMLIPSISDANPLRARIIVTAPPVIVTAPPVLLGAPCGGFAFGGHSAFIGGRSAFIGGTRFVPGFNNVNRFVPRGLGRLRR